MLPANELYFFRTPFSFVHACTHDKDHVVYDLWPGIGEVFRSFEGYHQPTVAVDASIVTFSRDGGLGLSGLLAIFRFFLLFPGVFLSRGRARSMRCDLVCPLKAWAFEGNFWECSSSIRGSI